MALPKISEIRYSAFVPSLNKEVEYVPYTVLQEKNLMLAMQSDNQKQITIQTKRLLTECLRTEGVNVDELTTFDVETLFLNLRCKSVGDVALVATRCTECDTVNEVDINLASVELTQELVDAKAMRIIVSEEDNIGVVLRYPRIDDVSHNDKSSDVENIYGMIINCMVSIYTPDEVFDCKQEGKKEVVAFVDSLRSSQFAKIAEFFEKVPSIKVDMQYSCIKCQHKYSREIVGLNNFFT